MPKSKQPASARKGYLVDKTNKEAKKVKQMKKDALNKNKTVERLMGSKNLASMAQGAYMWVKGAGMGKRALEEERKLEQRRKIRFGDRSR